MITSPDNAAWLREYAELLLQLYGERTVAVGYLISSADELERLRLRLIQRRYMWRKVSEELPPKPPDGAKIYLVGRWVDEYFVADRDAWNGYQFLDTNPSVWTEIPENPER